MDAGDGARRSCRSEVGLSPAFATEEVDRFTFRSPGAGDRRTSTATPSCSSYATRHEKQLGDRFDALKFHDLILAQGLLPPDLMRKAILAELQ